MTSAPGSRDGRPVSLLVIALAATALALVYRLVGDRTLWGECLTVWPPFVWCVPLAPRLTQLLVRRRIAEFLGIVLVAALFLVATVEWPVLSRVVQASPAAGRALRVVSWNVAGGMPLADLEALKPDLCLFQESATPGAFPAAWAGFHWKEASDPGTLSRYPITVLPTGEVGPWGAPQILRVDLPEGRRLIVANVHLMLPSIVVATADLDLPFGVVAAHRDRVGQFGKVAKLVADALSEQGATSAILCGDFNTPGGALSMEPLRRRLRDVWPLSGSGWGATMPAELPVSRIDQCWVSADIRPVSARVVAGHSDHRMLVVDLILGNP